MEFTFAYITAPDRETAGRIGKFLVEDRLAACVNLLPGMESQYWWQGKIESSHEVVLIAKTRASLKDALIERVLELHPAETPCVVFLPVEGGHSEYLQWIAAETEEA